jgi:NAD(P)H-hydrate epimerase
MYKILSPEQVRDADRYTIEHEPISSVDLMERAAKACTMWLLEKLKSNPQKVLVICGPGNNGGDGLAIARQLTENGVKVTVAIPDPHVKLSADCEVNVKRISNLPINKISYSQVPDEIANKDTILVDALFGSGISKPLEGKYRELVEFINSTQCIKVSIDLPSGLLADRPMPAGSIAVNADYTLSLHYPKLAFLMPENEFIIGSWEIIPIGLSSDFEQKVSCNHYLTEIEDIRQILQPRKRFSHKGTFGHALLIGGSYGKMGAAVLMGKSCLHAGVGLATVNVPQCGYTILQTAAPELMVITDENQTHITQLPKLDNFNTVAIGPGLGQDEQSAAVFKLLIQEVKVPLVIDADAINILAENPTWIAFLPKGSVLTPHPGEFARLAGKTNNSFERLTILRNLCMRYQINVILKGANSIICTSGGDCWFNPTGNPGMATAGSGDVLTGIIAGLLAQGYRTAEACIMAVYLHGLAGDLAAEENGLESITAQDIIHFLGKAFKKLY